MADASNLVMQQEAELKKVYKVGNQEYVLLKVQGQQAKSASPKHKTE